MKKIKYFVLLICGFVALFFLYRSFDVKSEDEIVDEKKDTISENNIQKENVLEKKEIITDIVLIETGVIYNIDNIRYFLHEDRTATVTHNGYYNKNVYFCCPDEFGECTNDSNGYVAKRIVVPSVVEYCGVEFSVTEIDEMAFAFCPFTEQVVIPSSVEKIGNSAFYMTSATIVCQNPEPPIVDGEYVLGYFDFLYDEVSLIVPKGAMQAYKEHSAWGKFGKIVER